MNDVARPGSFHMDSAGEWELYALEHGLPDLPAEIERGHAVPVARWVGPRYGAVLMVFRPEFGDNDGLPDEWDAQTEVVPYRRCGTGWEECDMSGGDGWYHPSLLVGPTLDPRVAHLRGEGGYFWSGDGTWRCRTMVGEAGADASCIEVEDDDGLARAPMESPLGVFVVAFDGEHDATVRVHAGQDVLLEEHIGGYGPDPP